jgi:diacylglycerol kinase family enzyme
MEEVISRICASIENCTWVKDLRYVPHLIINPFAGIFKHGKRYKRLIKLLNTFAPESESGVGTPSVVHVYSTLEHGSAAGFAKELFDLYPDPGQNHLVVIAAGDGTSHEALSSLVDSKEDCSNICVFRLPMGTGNDGADCGHMEETMDIWRGKADIKGQNVLTVTTAGGKIRHSFNIASLGLDAFVTDMTNKAKKIIPGNFYSVMVDMATLFYERLWKIHEMKITFDAGTVKIGKFLLVAMGVSGDRTYGNHKKILPAEENVCLVGPMKTGRKIFTKNLFYTGQHCGLPEVTMAGAKKLTIDYPQRILFQTDGEAECFNKEDFPVTMEVRDLGLTCLRKRPG